MKENAAPFTTIILAAGKGKRMNDQDLPKVMYRVDGKPMIRHVVELAEKLGSSSIIVIVGFKRETVIDYLKPIFGEAVSFATQEEQLGTGHAVIQAEKNLEGFSGDVLVLSGDVPLLTLNTMQKLLAAHRKERAVATVLTAEIDDPTGYGRILRAQDGSVDRIVEERDATSEEKQIREINSGIYLFEKNHLFRALRHVTPQNAQHEYYLTDVLGYFTHHGDKVVAVLAKHFDEIRGVNTHEQLQEAENALRSNGEVFGR